MSNRFKQTYILDHCTKSMAIVSWARFHKRVIAMTVLRIISLNYEDITTTHKMFYDGRIRYDIAECHRIDIIGVISSLGHDLYV